MCCRPVQLTVATGAYERRIQCSAMCATCPSLLGSVCGVSLQETIGHRACGTCPRGRFPDKRGRVRWKGWSWSGVPAPIRWRLWWRGRLRQTVLPGCGCIRALRVRWLLLVRAVW